MWVAKKKGDGRFYAIKKARQQFKGTGDRWRPNADRFFLLLRATESPQCDSINGTAACPHCSATLRALRQFSVSATLRRWFVRRERYTREVRAALKVQQDSVCEHLVRYVTCAAIIGTKWAHPLPLCTGTALIPATSAPAQRVGTPCAVQPRGVVNCTQNPRFPPAVAFGTCRRLRPFGLGFP